MKTRILISLILSFLAILSPGYGDVAVSKVVGSNMVLQRDLPVSIFGTADPGEKVTVKFADAVHETKGTAQGTWKVVLKPMKANATGQKMTISGKNTIELENILVGEVWVGSGQSNMELQLKGAQGGKDYISKADFPQVRLFHVPKKQYKTPAKDVNAAWNVCTPQSVPKFSAVLYFFGLRLHKDLKVPVGLINSSWGGSPIEPWTVNQQGSGGMFNGMIAPLLPFTIRGVIWYQGETNVIKKNGLSYALKMKALIEGWRAVWKQPKMPFYYVQIAPWSGKRYEPGQLPALWEAQVATLKVPFTGMIVVTDLVDNVADIHPRNKYDVGNRLALWALAKTYKKKDTIYSGPLLKSAKIEGNKIRVSFAHAKGLKSKDGGPLKEFKIAGADGKFVEAKAEIDGETVVVSAESVKAPKVVRFGWHKTANPNLVNGAGLPASPFQTMNWQGGTGE